MDLVPDRAPLIEGSFAAEFLAQPNPSVEGNPGHHLRVREVQPLAAHLPDPFIRFPPAVFEQPEHVPAELPRRQRSTDAVCPRLVHSVGDLTVDVELVLLCGGVADSY